MTESLINPTDTFAADPSLTGGNIKTPPHQTREQVLGLLEIEDDIDFVEHSKSFISKRLAELESGSTPESITYENNGIYNGFIHQESVVHPEAYEGEIAPGFMVDDPEIYDVLMAALRYQREGLRQKGKEIDSEGVVKSLFVNGVQSALIQYFGMDENAESRHHNKFMLDVSTDDQKMRYSLAELKGSAMCIEYAAAGNNLMNFLGMEGIQLVQGRVQSESSMGPGHHAFLVLEGSDAQQKLFDPMGPAMTYDYDKNAKRIKKPAIYPGAEQILNGEQLTVIREDTIVKEGQRTISEEQLTYSAR